MNIHLPEVCGWARTQIVVPIVAAALVVGCSREPQALLEPLEGGGGITFRHQPGCLGNRELPETMGGGVAVFDFEGDGDLDVYAVQSGPMRTPAGDESRVGAGNELWANVSPAGAAAPRFESVPDAGGAADLGYGQGVAVADANGDGHDDLYVLNWGPNALYLQSVDPAGTASFNRTSEAVFELDQWSVSAVFFDAELDGDLDLFEVNYLRCPPGSHAIPGLHVDAPGPFRSYPHPDLFRAQSDRLLLNDGTGRFRDGTEGSGIDGEPGKGLGAVATDADSDGLVDLYVTNDSTPNHFYRGLGDGRFERLGPTAGLAFNDDGLTEAGMGIDTADVDSDLDFDLVCTNLDRETNTLYLNQTEQGEQIHFRDQTRRSGLAEPSRPMVGFGCLFSDFDLDGNPDLFVANGHVIDNVSGFSDIRQFAQPDQLFLGDGQGRFALATAEQVPGLERPTVARGIALGDLNGDLAPDLVIGSCGVGEETGRALVIYLGRPDPKAVRVRLAGPPGNPRGLGATVIWETTSGLRRMARIESAKAYASASEAALTLGLREQRLAAIEVSLPGRPAKRFEGADVAGRDLLLDVRE